MAEDLRRIREVRKPTQSSAFLRLFSTLQRRDAGRHQTLAERGLEVVGSKGSLWRQDASYVYGSPDKPSVPVPTATAKPDRLVAAIRGELSATNLENDAAIFDAVAIMDA